SSATDEAVCCVCTERQPHRSSSGAAAQASMTNGGRIHAGKHWQNDFGRNVSKFPITFGTSSDSADDHGLRIDRHGIFQA
ncbi:MAG: hypothetical protein ACREC2_15895, partial [Bradyrhizobium sp.]